MNCPHCGMQAQIPPGVSPFLCGFCKRSFDVGSGASSGGGGHVVVYHSGYSSGYSMYWTIRLAAIAIVALLSAGGWLYHRMTGKQIAGLTDVDDDGDDAWSGAKPFVCDANDQVTLSGVTATFTAGPAINASGNCQVTCTGCTLRAPIGVQASGNAHVTITGGSLAGETAIVASVNATVDVRGDAKVSGTVSKTGNATVTGIAPPAASSAPPATVAHASAAPTSHPTTPPPAKPKKK